MMILKRIIDIREEYDLSQKDVANILDVSQQTYSRYETEEKIIPIKHLNKFCNHFKVSLDYVIGFTNTRNYKDSKDKINKNIVGKRLKEFRTNKNLTQQELAKELNTSHSTISAYENGKTLLLLAFAYGIATKYKVSLDWLYGRTDK
ncbi:MAG: helix-turn-helix transcriptional regulator [Bacilli bacterium]|nr:helix-turn-helix transcriptional regulator [Bacilli bacterium]